ncbi:MAG: sigma-54 interaction domain-containing protein [archaeon]
MIGNSYHTKRIREMVRKIGPSKSSVLITGSTGVGKEIVAKEIHENSPRYDKPFITINCAALSPTLLESELFGHERGAFTGAVMQHQGVFELAHRGTLFLDEIGEASHSLQTSLLRVLQENTIRRVGGTKDIPIDVRIISATNKNPKEVLREDIYYRLNVFSLNIPPLNQRKEDIPGLVQYFLIKFNKETDKIITGIEPNVESLFMRYSWPGNIRELENVMERAVVLAETETITVDEIPYEMFFEAEKSETFQDERDNIEIPDYSLVHLQEQTEKEIIYDALQQFRWNKTKVAEYLGLARTTLQYKIRKHDLENEHTHRILNFKQ